MMLKTGKLRIAFLTNEFVSEDDSYGGLASYLNRMTQALQQSGHDAEVFVSGRPTAGRVDYHGILVHRLRIEEPTWLRALDRLTRRRFRAPFGGAYGYVGNAIALSKALEARHAENPFDVVQSTNVGASSMFIRSRRGRTHLQRLSSDRAIGIRAEGKEMTLAARALVWLEVLGMRRADLVYAPSRCLADHTGRQYDVQVSVCRPPVFVDTPQLNDVGHLNLPARYLIHFGRIGRKKGADVAARALRLALDQEPGLQMVWAGMEEWPGDFRRCRELGGPGFDDAVRYLGKVRKADLYGILRGAAATVAPSVVDNLPNTVIESLIFGVPVIGTNGASIDELVEHGRSGELLPPGDAVALADAMVRVWRNEVPWTGSGFQRPAILDEMAPDKAVANLIRLSGCRAVGP